jgi:3-oxoacyl-[acyl-carrier protein] reductase
MNILVTGISKGLGLETARIALLRGMVVYGVSRSLTIELEKLMAEFPDSLKWKALDLAKANLDVRKALFKSDFISNCVPLNGFVNNAAIAYDDIVTNLNQDRLTEMFQANVFTPMMITKYTIRNMIFNRISGSIVHLSSISVHTGYKGLAMYAGSKGALEGFSKNTAREWGNHGIRSNCLVAGFMETNMSSTLTTDQKNRIYNRTSMKKPTTLKSVAETILFLLGDGAESITGQNIHVDAGTI